MLESLKTIHKAVKPLHRYSSIFLRKSSMNAVREDQTYPICIRRTLMQNSAKIEVQYNGNWSMEALTHSRFSSVYLMWNRSISITNRPGWFFLPLSKMCSSWNPEFRCQLLQNRSQCFQKGFSDTYQSCGSQINQTIPLLIIRGTCFHMKNHKGLSNMIP